MTDILSQLPEMTWRGIGPLPIVSRDWQFMHEHARHRLIFERDELIESLGGQNPPYRYTIPCHEDSARGPYKNLYTEVYPRFLEACLDESDGPLIDPFHGEIQVKCASVREIISVDVRDGIDVEVEYVVSPDDPDQNNLADQLTALGIEGARGVAGLFDQEIEKIDWQQEPSPEPTLGLFDAISAAANQIEVAANKPFAAIDDAIYRFEKAEESIDRLKDPLAAPAKTRARRLRLALFDERSSLTGKFLATFTGGNKKRARVYYVATDTGAIALASTLGMTFDAFLKANPLIRGMTIVKAGNTVVYFG